MPNIERSHDLNLPSWGPYSKNYAGVAHIPAPEQGLRFDVSVMPGYFRQNFVIPSEKHTSGQHAWEAAADLSYYAYRYELEWKDRVYVDVSYTALSKKSRLIRAEFVNNTDSYQNLMMHLVANLNFPPLRPDTHGILQIDNHIRLCKVDLPEGAIWFDALDYLELEYAHPKPSDRLVVDGWLRAEIRDHGFTGGCGIGCNFGNDRGDRVSFTIKTLSELNNAALVFRYRLPSGSTANFQLSGLIAEQDLRFTETDKDENGFCKLVVAIDSLPAGNHELILTSTGSANIELDGFALAQEQHASDIHFETHQWSPVPEYIQGDDAQSLILKYADTDTYYGLAWDHPDCWQREFICEDLDAVMRFMVPNNYTGHIDIGGSRHFTDLFLRPIPLSPNAQRTHYALACAGTLEEVKAELSTFKQNSDEQLEATYMEARNRRIKPRSLPSGDSFRFSQERMAATEMLNLVYPVYTRRQYIRNFAPGKWWDSLYTWDSGFIGLALLEYDTQLSLQNLNSYITEEGDEHCAFINHGSLIPTQIYQFHEIWNRTQDREMLKQTYPRLKQYHLFLAGHLAESTTRDLKSSLIRTWEIFRWDSGGWDDYPAQMHTLDNNLDQNIACAAVTAHVIRSAHILQTAAEVLGLEEDMKLYQSDIEELGNALQEHAWDPDAGYFSYVMHDDQGNPVEHLKTEDGINFNMGLDGVMPLFAGICSEEQETLLFERLIDPERFWTPIGLSTVDMSAPYYSKSGYWNGAVWMPHQWFIWRTALDLGRPELAHQIAATALQLWKKEVETSYYCFEHFLIESGRGAGWHQFGALSSPVVSWFSAYYQPGLLSTGMNIWIEQQAFSEDLTKFKGRLRLMTEPRKTTVIINLKECEEIVATWDETKLDWTLLHPGSFQIEIPFTSKSGTLDITVLSGKF